MDVDTKHPCARCGLTTGNVLDIGTGSACHPDLKDCIREQRAENERLREMVEWATAGWYDFGDIHGTWKHWDNNNPDGVGHWAGEFDTKWAAIEAAFAAWKEGMQK